MFYSSAISYERKHHTTICTYRPKLINLFYYTQKEVQVDGMLCRYVWLYGYILALIGTLCFKLLTLYQVTIVHMKIPDLHGCFDRTSILYVYLLRLRLCLVGNSVI